MERLDNIFGSLVNQQNKNKYYIPIQREWLTVALEDFASAKETATEIDQGKITEID